MILLSPLYCGARADITTSYREHREHKRPGKPGLLHTRGRCLACRLNSMTQISRSCQSTFSRDLHHAAHQASGRTPSRLRGACVGRRRGAQAVWAGVALLRLTEGDRGVSPGGPSRCRDGSRVRHGHCAQHRGVSTRSDGQRPRRADREKHVGRDHCPPERGGRR
jgi:hypothetical protein